MPQLYVLQIPMDFLKSVKHYRYAQVWKHRSSFVKNLLSQLYAWWPSLGIRSPRQQSHRKQPGFQSLKQELWIHSWAAYLWEYQSQIHCLELKTLSFSAQPFRKVRFHCRQKARALFWTVKPIPQAAPSAPISSNVSTVNWITVQLNVLILFRYLQ